MENFSVKTFSSSELSDFFYDKNEKNILLFDNLKYIDWASSFSMDGSKNYYICLLDKDNLIRGAIQLKTGGSNDYEYTDFCNWVMGFTIEEGYQGKGYSKLLIKELFKFLNDNGFDNLLMSSYTEEGDEKLRKNIRNESLKYPSILFQDKEELFIVHRNNFNFGKKS